jgi:hypothetical protein
MDPNLPNAERQRLEQGRAVLTQRLSASYPSEGARGSATFANVAPTSTPSAPSADALPPLDVPSRRAPASGGGKAAGVTPPVIGPFDPNAVKIAGTFYEGEAPKEVAEYGKERADYLKSQGVDPDLISKIISDVEGKKGKLEKRKGEAKGEALMQLGLGLMGARQGQEFQTLSESGIKALGAYKQDVKDLRAAEEKYDERIETLRMADQQAKQTGAEKDIARRDAAKDRFETAKMEKAKAQNELARTGAQVSAQVYGNQMQADVQRYGYEKSAETQRYVAGLQAQTSREYTASLKQQGLQDSQIKNIMGTAAEIYKAALAKNPMADETQTWAAALQQASSGYASLAPMVGRTMPGPVPAAPKLGKD